MSPIAFFALLAMPLAAAATAHAPGARAHASLPTALQAPVPAGDSDQTLRALHDEMARSVARLEIPEAGKPFYIEYRLLDLDVRTITASAGALVDSTTTRDRYMRIGVRVGDYHLDSSNFIGDEGYQGFLGSEGQVGIDRDYNSLRQDLWLSTDQAYKEAIIQMSLKQAFLRSLTKPPEIDDFSKSTPMVRVDTRVEPDWSTRNWEDEAREASKVLKTFPNVYGTRVNYYLVFSTSYLMTSEGTTIRTSRALVGVEAALDTQAEDGMPLHNYYAVYAMRPSELPDAATVSKGLANAATQLMNLRASPIVPDYTGPVLFDPAATGSTIAQVLTASLSGARPPLSMVSRYDEIMENMGGRSDWTSRVGSRVLPNTVTLVDDPTLKQYNGQPLLGSYDVDDEGVSAEKVNIVENGMLKGLLMSRRPGPDFEESNGHARSGMLGDPEPLPSNLILTSNEAQKPDDLRKKFLAACKDDGHEWCLEVKSMDNPALTSVHATDFSEYVGELAGGISSGLRIPLMIYRVYVADGREELVRGGRIDGLNTRSLRNMTAVGDDASVFTYMQNPNVGFAGTALGEFGSAQNGIPSTVIAPSILLDDVEVRGFHGEPRRLPIVTPPPLQ
jgi:predicted Zn-dependent protease